MDADRARAARRDGERRARAPPSDGRRAGVDAALADLGWLEMLDAEPRDAVDIVFGALGAPNAAATVARRRARRPRWA